jgi:hypothetical protein
MTSDGYALFGLQAMLGLLVIIAIGQDVWGRCRRTPGTSELTVTLGEKSFNVLAVMYATATLMCTLAVEVSEAFKGHKVWFIILDYGALTYLFFLNCWFRYTVVFPLYTRIRRG